MGAAGESRTLLDQTKQEWRNYASSTPGTGVFLVELAGGGYSRELVSSTYQQAVASGAQKGVPFKWVPESVSSLHLIRESECVNSGAPCFGRCEGLGCLCKDGICRP